MPLRCRFYKQKYPNVDDVVMVKVRSIAEMGAYVYLLEYNDIEGMILLSELSRRRIRSINKLIRVGKTEPVVVIRVDEEKGYIDLSKRRVSAEDVVKCNERYSKAKAVNSILRHVAELMNYSTDQQLEDLYEKTAWHFEEKHKSTKAFAYDFFKEAVNNPSILAECNLDAETESNLMSNIQRKLTSPSMKIRADIEVACFEYEGIIAVKEALTAGLMMGTEELPIRINLIAPPVYIVTTSTPEITDGLKALQNVIAKIEEIILSYNGSFRVIKAPSVVTAQDDAELARRIEMAEAENREVAGDNEDEEEEEGMRAPSDIEEEPATTNDKDEED